MSGENKGVEVKIEKDRVFIVVKERVLNALSVPALRDTVVKLAENPQVLGKDIILDLSNVEICDSRGISAIMSVRRLASTINKGMAIVTQNETLIKLFDIVKITHLIPIFRNINEVDFQKKP